MSEPADPIDATARDRTAAQAAAAASAIGIEVATLERHDDLLAAAGVLRTVWGSGDRAPVSHDLLRALQHSGSYVAGAFLGSELVGASVAFLADGGARPKLHSHITGLLPGSQHKGLGLALKLHQRAWAVERGMAVVSWTFDPLVRRNAFFNLTKLGATGDRFHVNFYGQMVDSVNVGDETDRCEATWTLTGPRVEAAAAGHGAEPDLEELRARGATVVLEADDEGRPVAHEVTGELRLCQVPDDIVALRTAAPGVARDWRLALRDALGASLADGFVATGATRTGWYVLERPT